VNPEEWESLCNLNISKAENEKKNSLSLRALVESLLEQTAADMRRQYEATGRAFELRIQETKTAKTQLENQLNEVGCRIVHPKFKFSHHQLLTSCNLG